MSAPGDSVQIRWNKLQKQVARLVADGKTGEGISLLDKFITSRLNQRVKAEALAFRADFKAESGKRREAIADYEAALALISTPTYARYTVEDALGAVHEDLGERAQALEWYHQALETALQDPGRTGASTIRRLVQLDEALSSVDRALCERVALKAWKAAGLSGDPDLSNLAETADAIMQAPV